MNAKELEHLKPFISIFLIISSLLLIVFAKMEERRMGYVILKLTREHRAIFEEKREKVFALAKIMRPENVEKIASDQFTLRKVKNNQIIHISVN